MDSRVKQIQSINFYTIIATLLSCLVCNMGEVSPTRTGMTTTISCTIKNKTIWMPQEKKYIAFHSATFCDIQVCQSNKCSCTLGSNSTLLTTCEGITTTSTTCEGITTSVRITYPEDSTILYLGNISLNSVNNVTFNGIPYGLKELYLNHNELTHLQAGMFDGLVDLKHLHLFCNKIQHIGLGVFDQLSSLVYLDLEYNLLSNLEPNIFLGLTQLRQLNVEKNRLSILFLDTFNDLINVQSIQLDHNRLVTLQAGVFEGLKRVEVIDVDNNLIEHISTGAFRGLDYLIEIDLDKNEIRELQPDVFDGLSNLRELELDNNKLIEIPRELFAEMPNIQELTLSYNMLQQIDAYILSGFDNLKELYASYNNLNDLHPSLFRETPNLEVLYIGHNNLQDLHPNIFQNLTSLKTLSLAQTNLKSLPSHIFEDLHSLEFLNISRNGLTKISPQLCQHLKSLTILDLTQNPLDWVSKESFQLLQKRTIVYVDEYATCCFIESATCSFESPPSPFISCKRLLPYSILRIVIWIVAIATILGNAFVIFTRCRQKTNKFYVQYFLITNLSLSDLLMGVYLLILLSVDLQYTYYFPSRSESWRQTSLCKCLGALALLSSEGSVFFITLISVDRFVSIKFPFSITRLRKKSVKVVVAILWLVAFLISISSAILPMLSPDFYDVSEICVGLPISRINTYKAKSKSFNLNITAVEPGFEVGRVVVTEFVGSEPAMFFSIGIFTVLNLTCFVIVAFCYSSIFVAARQSSRDAGQSTDKDKEIRMAFKMAGIVLTDFCCWVVVGVLTILVQSKTITINPEAYAWIATFVFPINSCMNPFLYTTYILISERLQRKKESTGNI